MVFNKFTHLARPSLSKSFAHGYAQSVVAATQSTTPFSPLGKHPSTKSGRPNTAHQQTPFSSVSAATASASRPAPPPSDVAQHDGGLKAYYDAWQGLQQHGCDGKEWKQYQFPKLIEPKAQPRKSDDKGKEKDLVVRSASSEDVGERGALDRAYSTSAVDDIKKAQDEAEKVEVAKVDAEIAKVIEQMKHTSAGQDEAQARSREPANGQVENAVQATVTVPGETSSVSPETKATVSLRSSPSSDATAATSTSTLSDLDALANLQRIEQLNHAQAFKEIPPAFESMLFHGIKPTAQAYNALLNSAVNLTIGRLHVVPKALDIYADMLRRKVSPNTAFYSSLLQILSHRALYAGLKRTDLEEQSRRYLGNTGSEDFTLLSHTAEHAIVAEDDAFENAVKIFKKAISTLEVCSFSPEVYRLLLLACAQRESMSDMVTVYRHLEAQQVTPTAAIFPAMITAFAKSNDLSSALECYNEYRSLAIADDAGKFSIIGRLDDQVYAALIRAQIMCRRPESGQRFFNKIVENHLTDTPERESQLEKIRDTVILEAFISQHLDNDDFPAALDVAERMPMSKEARRQAYLKICVIAADNSDIDSAIKAYSYLPAESCVHTPASLAIMALHIRERDLEAASKMWASLDATVDHDITFVTPTVFFANALVRDNQIDKASQMVRETFARIRASSFARHSQADVIDMVDEAIETLSKSISDSQHAISAFASVTLLRAMLENGGLIPSLTEQALAALGPEQVSRLTREDIILILQVQAGFIGNSEHGVEVIHCSRFGDLLDMATKSSVRFDERTIELIENAARKSSMIHPHIAARWHSYKHAYLEPSPPLPPLSAPVTQTASLFADHDDPHAATTDYKGSGIMIEQLENHRNSQGLNEALTRFRNIRRAGRHPRYVVYAKLITAAAKEGRVNLTHDILGMARNDIPVLIKSPIVCHGWSSILDAMVGACLTAGRRNLAEQFHQELLDMGCAPTANTYGLYITTLKESTKTFDEATEAVKIFHRATAEGVQPSSFLYNALIGKLGKARRIDDCLRYFQEMRVAGIRPTSVTYGTVVNALCRVSDEHFAEELFDEMEAASNYKPRPAPYNSLMQYFLTTKRDSQKVLAYYDRMQSMNIQPTMHTYKLLIDTYATLEPINLKAAENVLETIRRQGFRPEAVHYASLIHAKGCALNDMVEARNVFNQVLSSGEIRPQACLYQALFESMVASHCVGETEEILDSMSANRVEMTPYIANTLIHGWAMERQIAKSKAIYDSVALDKREPSTYEAMTRAFLTSEDRKGALAIVHEMLSRGYPSAVANKIVELVGHGTGRPFNAVSSGLVG